MPPSSAQSLLHQLAYVADDATGVDATGCCTAAAPTPVSRRHSWGAGAQREIMFGGCAGGLTNYNPARGERGAYARAQRVGTHDLGVLAPGGDLFQVA